MKRPVIGLSANLFPAEKRHFYDGKALLYAEQCMVNRVIGAGGVPVVLPVVDDPDLIAGQADLIDGLLLTGGTDIQPEIYGQEDRGWPGQPHRDRYEIAIVQAARAKRRPMLGVCRGHEILNVAFGGTLVQDILTDLPHCHSHRDQELYDTLKHPVKLAPDTLLVELFGATDVECNSIHHQAIATLGEGLVAAAWSDDGLVEAITAPDDHWTWGVQWHPEWDDAAPHLALFRSFLEACEP